MGPWCQWLNLFNLDHGNRWHLSLAYLGLIPCNCLWNAGRIPHLRHPFQNGPQYVGHRLDYSRLVLPLFLLRIVFNLPAGALTRTDKYRG